MKEAIATVMHSLLPPLLIQDEKKVRPVCGLRSWAWVISVSTHTEKPTNIHSPGQKSHEKERCKAERKNNMIGPTPLHTE